MDREYNLGFISDNDIRQHVKDTVMTYRTAISLGEFNRNIVDPIKLTFDSKVYQRPIETVIDNKCLRQTDKSNKCNRLFSSEPLQICRQRLGSSGQRRDWL